MPLITDRAALRWGWREGPLLRWIEWGTGVLEQEEWPGKNSEARRSGGFQAWRKRSSTMSTLLFRLGSPGRDWRIFSIECRTVE